MLSKWSDAPDWMNACTKASKLGSVHGIESRRPSASVDKQVRFTYRIMARIASFEAGVYWTPWYNTALWPPISLIVIRKIRTDSFA